MEHILRCWWKAFLMLVSLLIPLLVNAGGFQLNMQGQKAMGMGGGHYGKVMDASVAYFNPGGIVRLPNNSLTAGFNIAIPFTSYLDPYDGNTDMEEKISIPFNAYGNYKLKSRLSAGIAINTPYSTNVNWNENWTGRYLVIKNQFKSLNIQPTIAYAFNDHVSAGAGPVIGFAKIKKEKAIDWSGNSTSFGREELKASTTGFGFNAGLFFKYSKFSAGLSYRSMVKYKFDNGTSSCSDIPSSATIFEDIPTETDVSFTKSTPVVISAGLAYEWNEKLSMTLNTEFTQWSAIKSPEYIYADYPSFNHTELVDYRDAVTATIGMQYHYNDRTWVRGGIGYSQSSVKDGYLNPDFPDADKLIFSAGISYLLRPELSFDAAIVFQDFNERKEAGNMQYNFNGEYKTTIYIIGTGISYEF